MRSDYFGYVWERATTQLPTRESLVQRTGHFGLWISSGKTAGQGAFLPVADPEGELHADPEYLKFREQ